jgi:transposase InsO family protein
LRTSDGGEFYKNEFEEFCKTCGIARKMTNPYTPQHNGVAERMNRNLMEKARSMLSGAKLGHEFWVEAVDIACYLVNRSPSSMLVNKNIHEAWNGKNLS